MRGTVIRDGLVGFCEITKITPARHQTWQTPLQMKGEEALWHSKPSSYQIRPFNKGTTARATNL